MHEPVLSISLSIKHILPLEIIMNDQISFEIIYYKHYMKEDLSYKFLFPFTSSFTFQSRCLKNGLSLGLIAFYNNKKISEGKIILAGSDLLERRSSGEVISVLFLKPEIRIENKNKDQIEFSPSKSKLVSHIRIILNYKIDYSDSPFMNNNQSSDSNSSILKNLLELYKTSDNLNQRSRNSNNHILDYKTNNSRRIDFHKKGMIRKFQSLNCNSVGDTGKKVNIKRDVYYKVYKQSQYCFRNSTEKEYKSKLFNTIDYNNDKVNINYSIDNHNQYEEIKKMKSNQLVDFYQTTITQKKNSLLFTSPSKSIRKIKILLIENSNQVIKMKPNGHLYKELNELYNNSYKVLYELNKDLKKRLIDNINVYHEIYKKLLLNKAKLLFIEKSKCKIKVYNEIVRKLIKTFMKTSNCLYENNTFSRYLNEKQVIFTVCSALLTRSSSRKSNISINKEMSVKFERFINKYKVIERVKSI